MTGPRLGLPLDGGCQCGAARYRIDDAPLTLYCCHCRDCQAQSASAFGMSMLVKHDSLVVDWSVLGVWQRPTDSGNRLSCHFCRTCGSRLFHVGSADPAIVSVKAGSIDNREILRPVGHIWTDSAQPWFEVSAGTLVVARQPEAMDAFFARWREVSADWLARRC